MFTQLKHDFTRPDSNPDFLEGGLLRTWGPLVLEVFVRRSSGPFTRSDAQLTFLPDITHGLFLCKYSLADHLVYGHLKYFLVSCKWISETKSSVTWQMLLIQNKFLFWFVEYSTSDEFANNPPPKDPHPLRNPKKNGEGGGIVSEFIGWGYIPCGKLVTNMT